MSQINFYFYYYFLILPPITVSYQFLQILLYYYYLLVILNINKQIHLFSFLSPLHDMNEIFREFKGNFYLITQLSVSFS